MVGHMAIRKTCYGYVRIACDIAGKIEGSSMNTIDISDLDAPVAPAGFEGGVILEIIFIVRYL